MEKTKWGVFVARFQPIHNAHLWMIEQALKENDKVLVVLGSANKVDMLRNPFDFNLRVNLFKDHMFSSGNFDLDRVEIINLPDWSKEDNYEDTQTWGQYLYYNIVSRIQTKKFSIYYSDKPEIIKSWFPENIANNITFRIFERNNLFDGLSATKIREAFGTGDYMYIKKYCPDIIFRKMPTLRNIWLRVKDDPKEDFSME